MSVDQVSLDHSSADVLLMCLEIQQADRPITLSQLRRHFGVEVNPARILRQFFEQGWVSRGPGSTPRAPNYLLTPAGQIQAQSASLAQQERAVTTERAWEKENLVYGVPRAPFEGPLNDRQIQAWVNGYWREQFAKSTPPEEAPQEVKAAWATCIRRVDRHLAPYHPKTGFRETVTPSSTAVVSRPPRPR